MKNKGGKYKGGNCLSNVSPSFETLDFDRFPPSIERLPAELTINGVTKVPMFRYRGIDANSTNWVPWGYGYVANKNVVGSDPNFFVGTPLCGNNDFGVENLGGSNYYIGSSASIYDLTTEDLVIECFFKNSMPATHARILVQKRFDPRMWEVSPHNNKTIRFSVGDAATTKTAVSAATVDDAWYHIICVCDKSENSNQGMRIYLNGQFSGTGANPSTLGSITSNASFKMLSDGGNDGSVLLAYAAMWQGNNWLNLSSTTEMDTIASTRYAQLMGIYPSKAVGTSLPTSFTRASSAYVDKVAKDGTRKLFYMPSGMVRPSLRIDSNNRQVKGLLIERSATNQILQSQTFGTTWNQNKCTITSDALFSPDGTVTADVIVETNDNGDHNVTQTKDMGSVGNVVCYSVFVKSITRNYCNIYGRAQGDAHAIINLSTGVTTILLSRFDFAGAINYGNGWWRFYCGGIVDVDDSWEFSISSNISGVPGTNNYAGTLGQQAIAVWGAQAELGDYPSSYIPTTTGAVTRAADVLYYSATSNVKSGIGKIKSTILVPNYDLTISNQHIVSLSNAGSANNSISSYIATTSDNACVDCWSGGSNQFGISGSSDVVSGVQKDIECSWNKDLALDKVGGSIEAIGNGSYTIPTVDRIYIGSDAAGAKQLNGLIKNIRIYSKNRGTR